MRTRTFCNFQELFHVIHTFSVNFHSSELKGGDGPWHSPWGRARKTLDRLQEQDRQIHTSHSHTFVCLGGKHCVNHLI